MVRQQLGLVSLVVRDYDEAIAFFTQIMGFNLVEDTWLSEQNKRWVVVSPPGGVSAGLLLARASDAEQATRIGNQTGGRVAFFLFTDNFERDHALYQQRGVEFVRPPRRESYGTVAVFKDLCGNLWDLLEPAAQGLPARLKDAV